MMNSIEGAGLSAPSMLLTLQIISFCRYITKLISLTTNQRSTPMFIYSSISDLKDHKNPPQMFDTYAQLVNEIKPDLTWNGYFRDVEIHTEEELENYVLPKPPPGMESRANRCLLGTSHLSGDGHIFQRDSFRFETENTHRCGMRSAGRSLESSRASGARSRRNRHEKVIHRRTGQEV